MAIKFRCDSCGKKLGVADSLAGRRGKCPDCGFLFTVPVPGAAPPPPPRVMRQEDTDYSVSLDGPDQAADGPAADPDLLFGRLAVKAGYLTEEQVQGLVGSQARAASDGTSVTLGELCQSRRLLTSGQVQSLLLAQEFALLRAEDKRLGQLAVRNGFATEDDVRAALDEQKRAYGESRTLPRRLGEILVEMGTLSEQQISALLKAQARLAGQGSASAPAARTTAAPAEPPTEPLPSTTPSGEAVTGWLVQEAGEAAGTTYAMAVKAILGRQPTNEVPLPETRASRQHAKVEYIALAKQHVVTDLNSRNGTSVNGEPLTGPRALQPGDRIQIGDTVLRYEAGTGVTPGFIPPGVTMSAPGARMGSQVRRETVAMSAARPHPPDQAATARRDGSAAAVPPPARHVPPRPGAKSVRPATPPSPPMPPTMPPEPAAPQPSLVGAPVHRKGVAFPRKKSVLVAGVLLLLSVAAGTWILSRPHREAGPTIAASGSTTGEHAANEPAPVPPTPTDGHVTTPRLDSKRQARAKIEQAKDRIASRDFEGAEALLREALSLDPASEAEIVPLFEAADQGLSEGNTAAPVAEPGETPAALAPKFRAGDTLQFTGDSVWVVYRGMNMGAAMESNNQFQEDASTTGKFVRVYYAVQNLGTKTDRIFIRPKLVDSKGREYEPYDGEDFYIPKGAKTIGMEQLTPNICKQLWAVYEVAADADGLMFRARSLASEDANSLVALDICPACNGLCGLDDKKCAKCHNTGVFGPNGVPPELDKAINGDKGAGDQNAKGAAAGQPPESDPARGSGSGAANETAPCPTCGGRGTVTVECDACLGSPSAARGAEWKEHMDAGNSALGSQDFHGAVEELRAALRIAETFGEHDVRLAESLIALGGLLKMWPNQRNEGEAMVKRGKDIVEHLRQNGLSEEKKCAKCKGTGKITTACPDCRGKKAGGDEPSSAVCPACGGAKGFKCTACETGQVTTDCPACHRRGNIACDLCKGRGYTECDCGGKRDNCPNCHGYGQIKCDKCHGQGRLECKKCNSTGHVTGPCPVCNGKRWVPCKDCHGTGVEQTPATVAEEKAAGLLSVAQAFETNKKPDLAIQRYQELLAKYPDTEAAATARKRLEELQARDPGK